MNKYMALIHGYDIYKNFNYKKYPTRIFGWNINSELYKTYIDTIQPELILELGTWLGGSAIAMAKIIKEKGITTKIICVDTWLGSLEFIGLKEKDEHRSLVPINGHPTIYNQFLANVIHENLQDIIIPLPNTIHLACTFLSINNIHADIIYVDGDNTFESVYSDLNNSWPLLNNKGVIFGDDLQNAGFPGIRFGLNKFCLEQNIEYHPVTNFDNFWEIYKKHNI